VTLPITHNNIIYNKVFEVIKGDFEPLLGLKSCTNLNLISIISLMKWSKVNKKFSKKTQGVGSPMVLK